MNSYNQTAFKAAACPLHLSRTIMGEKPTGSSQDGITNIGRGVHDFAKEYFNHCWKAKVQTDVEAGEKIARKLMVWTGMEEREREEEEREREAVRENTALVVGGLTIAALLVGLLSG